jgi:MoxR-like ATPase
MQERQVTIEGHTFPLEEPFMVIATRNPLEFEGVYPLIEAQIDRFMFRLNLGYPTADEEHELIERLSAITQVKVNRVGSKERVRELSALVEKVHVSGDMKAYMETLVRKTRELKEIQLGASPRALIHLYTASKARALVERRDYVIPDDVKALINPVLNHRMRLSRESETEGLTIEDIVKKTVSNTPIPGLRVQRSTP